MDYFKQTLILKQVDEGFKLSSNSLGGIVRLSLDDDILGLTLSVVNATPITEGEYKLYLLDGKGKMLSFALGIRPTSFSTTIIQEFCISSGVSVGLCYEKDFVPLVLCYCKSENHQTGFVEFKSLLANYAYNQFKSANQTNPQQPKVEEVFSKNILTDGTEVEGQNLRKCYDDEAVATENYFDYNQSSCAVKREEEKVSDCQDCCDNQDNEEGQDGWFQLEDGLFDFTSQAQTQESQKDGIFNTISADADKSQKYTGEQPFYLTAKQELDNLFDKFPEFDGLSTYFPDSRFVKIYYAENKYYVVGVIKENKQEKYICYGVPSPYTEKAPKELEGYCTFIPLSIFDMKGDGLWMMFQDALSGECVKK